MSNNTETKSEAKSSGKTSGKTTYNTPILNPAWAEEVVKAQGLSGPLAKAIAADLAQEATKALSKYMNHDRVTKMIKKSFGNHVGKVNTSKSSA